VRSTSNVNPILLRAKYRSKLEEKVAKQLEDAGIDFTYEKVKIPYTVPAREAKYVSDFAINIGGKLIILEAKGRFAHRGGDDAKERHKFLLLKQQYPDLDLRFVFQSAHKTKIYPGSKTTVAQWAETHGFPYSDKGTIPQSWLMELKQTK
jgi:hypothetical protein